MVEVETNSNMTGIEVLLKQNFDEKIFLVKFFRKNLWLGQSQSDLRLVFKKKGGRV